MTDSLTALATRVETLADELRSRAGRLVSTAASTQWQSSAAQAFRRDVDRLAAHMRAVAARVDAAGAAVRRHAAVVTAVERAVEQRARDVERTVSSVARELRAFIEP